MHAWDCTIELVARIILSAAIIIFVRATIKTTFTNKLHGNAHSCDFAEEKVFCVAVGPFASDFIGAIVTLLVVVASLMLWNTLAVVYTSKLIFLAYTGLGFVGLVRAVRVSVAVVGIGYAGRADDSAGSVSRVTPVTLELMFFANALSWWASNFIWYADEFSLRADASLAVALHLEPGLINVAIISVTWAVLS
jgi:hypothetical protein